ncbi:hypothetical protein E4U52_002435 [Claviceps spartinae]|nr:hypothetical protein E4U52_002435 [Claviceps spartinae]
MHISNGNNLQERHQHTTRTSGDQEIRRSGDQEIRRWDTAYADDRGGREQRQDDKGQGEKKRKIKVMLIRISMQKAKTP